MDQRTHRRATQGTGRSSGAGQPRRAAATIRLRERALPAAGRRRGPRARARFRRPRVRRGARAG